MPHTRYKTIIGKQAEQARGLEPFVEAIFPLLEKGYDLCLSARLFPEKENIFKGIILPDQAETNRQAAGAIYHDCSILINSGKLNTMVNSPNHRRGNLFFRVSSLQKLAQIVANGHHVDPNEEYLNFIEKVIRRHYFSALKKSLERNEEFDSHRIAPEFVWPEYSEEDFSRRY